MLGEIALAIVLLVIGLFMAAAAFTSGDWETGESPPMALPVFLLGLAFVVVAIGLGGHAGFEATKALWERL